jgi:hypothetical protein
MLSCLLNSERAISVNILIIRVFTKLREMVLAHKDILIKLEQIEKAMLLQDSTMNRHEAEIQAILEALKELLNPPTEPRPRIRFRRADERD